MKRTCLIILLLLKGALLSLQAQTPISITFDFQAKKFKDGDAEKLQQLKLGDLYQLKINNINTNLYKISIGKRDTIINTALTMPTFGTFGVDALQSLVGGLATGNILGATQMGSLLDIRTTNTQLQLQNFLVGNDFTTDLKNFAHDKGLTRAPTKPEIIKGLQYSYETSLKSSYTKLNALKVRTDALVNDYNKFLIQVQVEDKTNAATTSFFSTTGLTPNDLYSKFNAIRTELNQINDDVNTANNKYLETTKQYGDDIKNAPDLKASDDQLKATYTAFSTTITKAIDVVSPDNAMKLISAVITTINNQSRSYTSLPMQFTKDQNTLVFSIMPRKDDSELEPYTTTFAFPIKKNYFWAVSSGIYISPMYNHSYSVQKNISAKDTSYSIISEKPPRMEFGVNAMMRYGSKICKKDDLFWQLGFGPGVSVSDKVRPRALLGTGLAFGSRSKLVLDVGLIAGYSEQLSVLYQENGNYQTAPSPITVSKFSTNGYFSIGYLFH